MSNEFLGEELYVVIQKHIAAYKSLLDLMSNEMKYLVKFSIPEIQETNQNKDKLIHLIKELEKKRRHIVEKFCKWNGIRETTIPLLEISEKIGGKQGRALKNSHSVLSALMERVKLINEENKGFIEHSIETMDQLISSLGQIVTKKGVYTSSGEKNNKPKTKGKFFNKEF